MFSLILVFNFRFVIYCCLFFNNIMKTTTSFGLAFFKLLVNVRSSSMFSYLNSNKTQFLDNAQIFFFFNANTNRCCYLFHNLSSKKNVSLYFFFHFSAKTKVNSPVSKGSHNALLFSVSLLISDLVLQFSFFCTFSVPWKPCTFLYLGITQTFAFVLFKYINVFYDFYIV